MQEDISASESTKRSSTDMDNGGNRSRTDSINSINSKQMDSFGEHQTTVEQIDGNEEDDGSIDDDDDIVQGQQQPEQAPHVEYILVAEFEVDQGPLMEHQYPTAISGDEQ